jgi:CBS domain-containing protein
MRAEELMKKSVECLEPSDTAQRAAEVMRDQNLGFIPICGADGAPQGTLTDRDIAIRLVAEERSYGTLVQDIMTSEVVSCRPEDDLSLVMRLMRENHKSRILVCDDEGRVIGVISLSDIARVAEDEVGATLSGVAEREA